MNSFKFNGLISLAKKNPLKCFCCLDNGKTTDHLDLYSSTVFENSLKETDRSVRIDRYHPFYTFTQACCVSLQLTWIHYTDACSKMCVYVNSWLLFLFTYFRLPAKWQRLSKLHVVCPRTGDVIKPLLTVGRHQPGTFTLSQCSPTLQVTNSQLQMGWYKLFFFLS